MRIVRWLKAPTLSIKDHPHTTPDGTHACNYLHANSANVLVCSIHNSTTPNAIVSNSLAPPPRTHQIYARRKAAQGTDGLQEALVAQPLTQPSNRIIIEPPSTTAEEEVEVSIFRREHSQCF